MKFKTFLTMALMAVPGVAAAQNTLTVTETTISQNGGNLKFNFTFAEENVYTSYQFKIETPEGVVYDTDEDGDVACTLGACHTNSHAATVHWNADTRILGVGVASLSTSLLKGTAGELISIPLLEIDAVVGSTLTFNVVDITYIRKDGTKDKLNDLEVNITVGGSTDSRLILNENATSAPDDTEGVDVLVKRTIVGGVWNTLCLPFSMTAEQVTEAFGDGVRMAEFTNWEVDGNNVKLTFTEGATSIEKNVPCLIKVEEGLTEFTVDGVDIEPERNSKGKLVDPYVEVKVGRKYGYFTGAYTVTDLPVNSLFLNNDRLWFCTGSNTTKAFRGYFEIDDVEYSAETRLSITVDSDVTGITERNYRHYHNDGNTYDLQGRKVNSKQKGVYIENGKKVVVK